MLVEAFVRGYGRIALVAKGVRSAKSARRGLLEPFRPLLISWTQRGEMGTLTGLESAGVAVALTGSALWCGFYCNELVLRLIPRQDVADSLWGVYTEVLPGLVDTQRRPGGLRRFELTLLDELGAAPDLATDAASGVPVSGNGLYRLDPDAGPCAIRTGTGIPGRLLLALAQGRFDQTDTMHAARQVTRVLLDRQLDGRPLKSREMFFQGGVS